MIKKLLLLISLFAFTVAFIPLSKVRALPSVSNDYSDYFEIVLVAPTVYAIFWDLDFEQGQFGEIEYQFPACAFCVNSRDGQDSYLRIQSDGGTVWTETTDTMGIDWSTPPFITVDFMSGGVSAGLYSDTEALIVNADSVTLQVLITATTAPPYAVVRGIREAVPVIISSYAYPVIFYDRFELYDLQWLTPSLHTPLVDPTPPTGFTFGGWKTIDGRTFNFTSLATDDHMLNDTTEYGVHLPLYAYYTSQFGDSYIAPSTALDDPAGITGIFGSLGFGDEEGYMLLFVLTVIILDLLLTMAWHVHPNITIIVDVMWGAFWLAMGILPIIAFIFVLLIGVAVFIKLNFSEGVAS